MDDEADAAREYERLRAELADFVLDALAQRIADGQEPRLSQALVEAIDRRVEEAVAARLAEAEWPDPDAFADSVIAAAAGRGGGERPEASRPRRSERQGQGTAREPVRQRRLRGPQLALIALIGIAIVAAATYFGLRGWNAGTTNTVVMEVDPRTKEPTPDGASNVQQPPSGNVAVPASAGAAGNIQGPTP